MLESHPPSAIIIHGRFLSALLELIYDSNEAPNHTIIVLGDYDEKKLNTMGQLKVYRWEHVESEGRRADPISQPTAAGIFYR